jgi:valyl-tRNA synthetase
MPFVTEELWAVTSSSSVSTDTDSAQRGPRMTRESMLALAPWPSLEVSDDEAEAEIGWVIDLITAIRSVRAEMTINTPIPLLLVGGSAGTSARAARWAEFIKRLARVSGISPAASPPPGSVQLIVRGEVAALPLKGIIDVAAERVRLQKEMAKADSDIARVDAKLANAKFLANAPEEIVEEEKEKRAEAVARRTKIADALKTLEAAT